MKKNLLALSIILALTACGGSPAEPAASKPEVQAVEAKASSEKEATLPTIKLNYSDYQAAANKILKAAKTGLSIPDHVVPTNNSAGTKNMLHDFSDGLVLSVETDKSDNMAEIRVVWDTDTAPNKAEKLSNAAAALIAATAPEDRSLERDTRSQIKMAIESHNAQRNPTREWTRGGIAYKVTVTNLPSVVLTAKLE